MFKAHVHYDKDLESAVLGACLIEKFGLARVKGILNPECFYSDGNRIVYETMVEMWEESFPIDALTVTSRIVRNKGIESLDNNNPPYFITRMMNAVVNTANMEAHALILRQLYAEREFVRIKNLPYKEGEDVIERTKKIQDEYFKITQIKVSNDWKDMVDVITDLHKHMDEVQGKLVMGIPTGFDKLDKVTGGMCNSQMIVIGARPAVGKSALLNSIAIYAASEGFNVGIISLEMPSVQIAARMGALISEVDFYKIYRNILKDESEKDRVNSYLSTLSQLPIMISDKTGVNVSDIKAKAIQLINKKKLDVLFIDYLQLVDGETSNRNYNREQEVSKLSRGIKIMAMEFNIPIVVLCQLNREAEKTKDKKPELHHLRESGAIEQDADLVMFLHRDWKSGIETNEHGQTTEFEADIILAKGRNIETPEIKIGFDPPKMRFYDLEKEPYKQKPVIYKDFTEPKSGLTDDLKNTFD